MPYIAYGGARPLTGLGHVCSRLFSEMITYLLLGWPHDYGQGSNKGQNQITGSRDFIYLGITMYAIAY